MKLWRAVLAVLLCLTLSACGGETEDGGASALGQAAGLDDSIVLLTVNGREVAAWQYLYWLDFTCSRLAGRYQEAGIPLDWDAPSGSGGTLAAYAKAQALSDTALYAVVEAWAEQYGCVLSGEELDGLWPEQCAAHGGEEAYLAYLAEQGLNRERWAALTGTGLLYGKLCALYETPGSPVAALASGGSGAAVRRIFTSAGEDREAARERIAEMFSRLNSAEDQRAAFDALAAEGDVPGALPSSLEEAAAELEEGQFSGILEAEDGFSILLRLPGEDAPGDIDDFDRLLESAAASASIQTTEAYADIDPAAFAGARQSSRQNA